MTLRALLPRGASWRLALARALAWSLLIGGWIGIAALAERLTAGPLAAAAVVALWLLATGFASEALGRVRWPVGGLRAGMLLAAGLAAWAGRAALQGGGTPTLVVLALASACVLALASTTVRALRPSPAVAAPASPVGAATVGAVLAWAAVGDPSDLLAMADRLAVLLVLAAAVLAALRPRAGGAGRASARPGCRAGLFLTLTRPDDWHLHLRDGAALAAVLPFTARQFAAPSSCPTCAAGHHRRAGAGLPRAHPGRAAGRQPTSRR
jgi:hypothetical protein